MIFKRCGHRAREQCQTALIALESNNQRERQETRSSNQALVPEPSPFMSWSSTAQSRCSVNMNGIEASLSEIFFPISLLSSLPTLFSSGRRDAKRYRSSPALFHLLKSLPEVDGVVCLVQSVFRQTLGLLAVLLCSVSRATGQGMLAFHPARWAFHQTRGTRVFGVWTGMSGNKHLK